MLLLALNSTLLMGQVQILLNMDANPNPRISDWVDRNEVLTLTVTSSNPSLEGKEYKIRFRLYLEDNLVADNNLTLMPVHAVVTGSEVFMADEVVPGNAVNFYGNIREKVIRTGMLPAGNYRACVSLLDLNGQTLSTPTEVCRNLMITAYQAPELIWPAGDVEVTASQLMSAMFTWSPMSPVPPASEGLQYKFVISEVLSHQNPSQALLVNYPGVMEVDYFTIGRLMMLDELSFLEAGKRYVWSVMPVNLNGEPWFEENAGFAKPVTFRIKSEEPVVAGTPDSGKTIRYNFTVLYPEGVDQSEAVALQGALNESFAGRTILAGKPKNKLVTLPDATGKIAAQNPGADQLAEALFAMVEAGGGWQAGGGVTVIGAKQSPCPPDPCGCKKDNTVTFYCNCTMALGWCMCAFCPIFSEIKAIEEEDISLTLGKRIVPPVTTDTSEVKDIIIVMMAEESQTVRDVMSGITKGLEQVNTFRQNGYPASGNAPVRYDLPMKEIAGKEVKYRFHLMYPEDGSVDPQSVQSTGNDLEKAFAGVKIIAGETDRMVKGVAPSDGSAGGENHELSEAMFNLIQSGGGPAVGTGITVIGAKQAPCPPNPCGCKQDNSVTFYCNCSMHNGWCMCMFCPEFSDIKEIVVEDPVLTFRTVPLPPVTTDSVVVKDVIIMMMKPGSNEPNEVVPGINKALDVIAAQRKLTKADAGVFETGY